MNKERKEDILHAMLLRGVIEDDPLCDLDGCVDDLTSEEMQWARSQEYSVCVIINTALETLNKLV